MRTGAPRTTSRSDRSICSTIRSCVSRSRPSTSSLACSDTGERRPARTSSMSTNDHNGFSHQGPGLIDVMLSKKGTVSRIYLPPDANCLLTTADHCFRSRNYVNLIVIDKQPQLQWLGIDDAIQHCARGASAWRWAGTDEGGEPDV